jgi:hypothetical protein
MNPQPPPPTRSELAPSDDGAGKDTNQTLPTVQSLFAPRAWPEEIIVEPARLDLGVFGGQEGDISAAYCADTLPKVSTFLHDGQRFANCGGSENSVCCYPLLSPGDGTATKKKPYSHEGETVKLGKQSFTLGPQVKFTARPRTIQEETSLLRRMYAHGGYFVAGKTYREMLLEFLERDRTSAERKIAAAGEMAREGLPTTQAEMLRQLGASPEQTNSEGGPDISQPTLPGL